MKNVEKKLGNSRYKFRAWVEYGDNSEAHGIVKNVAVYSNGDLAASLDDFDEGIKESGYYLADDSFTPFDKSKELIDADEFNIRELEDWVWFEGIAEQFTGLHDKDGKEIFCNDVVQDSLTKQIYLVKFGYCLKLGFTGWYAESKDGYQCAINGDYGTDKNSCLVVLGAYRSNPELLK